MLRTMTNVLHFFRPSKGRWLWLVLLKFVFVIRLQQINNIKSKKKKQKCTYTYTIFNTSYYKSIQWVVLTFLLHLRGYQFSVHMIRSPFIEVYHLNHGVRTRAHKYMSPLLGRLVKKGWLFRLSRGNNPWLFVSPNVGEFLSKNPTIFPLKYGVSKYQNIYLYLLFRHKVFKMFRPSYLSTRTCRFLRRLLLWLWQCQWANMRGCNF